jgi:predicted PurR-regulated permease PerM
MHPFTWLQQRKMGRTAASLLVFFGVLAVFWFDRMDGSAKMVTQIKLLITNLPQYLASLNQRLSDWVGNTGSGDAQSSSSSTLFTDQLPPFSSTA